MGEICRLDFSCGQPFLSPYFYIFLKYIIPPLSSWKSTCPQIKRVWWWSLSCWPSALRVGGRATCCTYIGLSWHEIIAGWREICGFLFCPGKLKRWARSSAVVVPLQETGEAIIRDGIVSQWLQKPSPAAHLLGLAPFFHQSFSLSLYIQYGKQRLLYLEQ